MFIYDSTSIAFMRKSEEMAREILLGIGVKVNRQRFLFHGFLYPLRVVVFEGTELGHFNGPYLQIALNRKLIYTAKDSVLRDILKHEIAHYLTYIRFGEVAPHGSEFKKICEEFGFDQGISSATMNLELSNENKVGDLVSERILEKVKKLLQLAESSNVHEAELATMKANEILLRHNLDRIQKDDEPVYLERVLQQSRKDTKQMAILDILHQFVVKPVLSSGKNICCIEVSGSRTNVELATYVAEFLNRELDHLWEVSRKEHSLSGLRAKNSFFMGVAKGFSEKMKRAKSGLTTQDQKSLIVVEQRLEFDTRLIYGRLSTTHTISNVDLTAREIGVQKGQILTIKRALQGTLKNLFLK